MSKFEEILEKLENVKMNSQKSATALCPCHDDTKNSLSITQTEKGKILIHCFAGCKYEDIINKLGYIKKDLNSNKKIVATYNYLDENYNLLYQVVRTDPKGFFQRRPNENGSWNNGLGDARRVIYNLPYVLSAIQRKLTVFFVEGEKDAETLNKLGFVATTSPMGAGSFKKEFAEFFINANVVILPDSDPPGEAFGQTVAKALKENGAMVKVLHLPNLKSKDDVTDWINRGGTRQELLRLVEKVPYYEIIRSEQESYKSINNKVLIPCTDLGNAERLCNKYGEDIRYCYEIKSWIYWSGQRWVWDKSGEIERMAKIVVREIYNEAAMEDDKDTRRQIVEWAKESESKPRIKALVELAKTEKGIPISRNDFDKNDWLLNCLNGTIDLKTGTICEHNKLDYITLLSPVNFDPKAKSDILDVFMNKILPSDNLKNFVQTAAGYTISGSTAEEVMFFPFGPSATGKSTLLSAIKETLGDYANQTDFETFLDKKSNNGPRNDLAMLVNKRLVLSSEVDEGKKMAESLMKQITGNDTISARFLYGEFFEFKPKFKLWLAANFRPRISNTDKAIWRRILQIPFIVEIPKDERDPNIKLFLSNPVEGGPAVLNWLIEGCLRYQKEGLIVPTEVRDFTNDYQNEMDPLKDFLQDCCIISQGMYVNNTKLFNEYEEWCKKNGERFIISRKKFTQNLEAKGLEQTRTSSERLWKGIGLKAIDLSEDIIPETGNKIIDLNLSKDISANTNLKKIQKNDLQHLLF